MDHQELPSSYDASQVESVIYKKWLDSGYFNPDNLPDAETREPFTIVMPPPNANAPLHVGHALFATIEDIIIRYQRMQGKKALWQPGMDHAGFETQVVYEKKLDKEGRSRFQMTREEFYKEVWDFVQQNKHISEEGLKRLGASCDWDRNIFTLDPEIIKIVYQTFKQMYEDGLVYRAGRICNWCPKHQTGLADLETKYEERTDKFYYLQYGPFTIGTARPETKFSDKYVVMHPDDSRYAQYAHGQKFTVEWINGPIEATVIKDPSADMEFGTGVMTITPAHDATDFDIAKKYNLDIEQIIDKRGKLLPVAGEFAGMKIQDAREKIVEKLASKGLVEKIDENYKHNVQLCYKCGNIIEPQIVDQWYIAMNKQLPDGRPSLRDMALKALDTKEVEIITERFEKIFRHWMENLRDWPISRQIWWGISIPAYYDFEDEENSDQIILNFDFDTPPFTLPTDQKDKFIQKIKSKDYCSWYIESYHSAHLVSASAGNLKEFVSQGFTTWEKIKQCKFTITYNKSTKPIVSAEALAKTNNSLFQDQDTFDTWFSSGQWPYATLMANDAKHGTNDIATYFPTQVMETGWDILFFWIARMVMLSYYRTDKPPFQKVYLHGLVRDKDRQKMSKSKGNVIDPLGVIDTYGTDALRFALVFSTSAGNDIPLAEERIKGMKHFANKLWNIARFVMTNVEASDWQYEAETEADTNILNNLNNTIIQATKNFDTYNLHEAAQEIYQFTWHEFADIYIEKSKEQMRNPELADNTKKILLHTLINTVKLLHPFMPFVTEHIWGLLNERGLLGKDDLLIVAKWPKA